MERFAFKIDSALRANLYKICRLCGIDNPEKVPLLSTDIDAAVDLEAEPELCSKVKMLVGLNISKNDKMPQDVCVLCVDKVNDFYEFREMCLSTQRQTRRLLGLKCEEQEDSFVAVKEESGVQNEPRRRGRPCKRKFFDPPTVVLPEVKRELQPRHPCLMMDNKRRRKQVFTMSRIGEIQLTTKPEIKEEPLSIAPSRWKYKEQCNICHEGFVSQLKLKIHVRVVHVPNVPRYICLTCNETFKKIAEIKHHQSWHKMTKTPYKCGLCGFNVLTLYSFSRHLREHNVEVPATMLDRVCPQCGVSFATNFLYNIHACSQFTRICGGCDLVLGVDEEYLTHAAHCVKAYLNYTPHIFPVVANASESTAEYSVHIKNENEVEAAAEVASHVTTVQTLERLPPTPMVNGAVVSIPCATDTGIRLKQELLDETEVERRVIGDATEDINRYEWDRHDDYGDDESTDECDVSRLVEVTIKQEPTAGKEETSHRETSKGPPLKLKIKKEQGTLSSSLLDGLPATATEMVVDRDKKKKKVDYGEENTVDRIVRINNAVDGIAPPIVSPLLPIKEELMEEEMGSQKQTPGHLLLTSEAADPIVRDVKPNRAELDRLISINNKTSVPPVQSELRIAAVRSGVVLDKSVTLSSVTPFEPVHIKEEPSYAEYQDVWCAQDGFHPVNIKHEPELELNDVYMLKNQLNSSGKLGPSSESVSTDKNTQEEQGGVQVESIMDQREYREMSSPPPSTSVQPQNDGNDATLTVIELSTSTETNIINNHPAFSPHAGEQQPSLTDASLVSSTLCSAANVLNIMDEKRGLESHIADETVVNTEKPATSVVEALTQTLYGNVAHVKEATLEARPFSEPRTEANHSSTSELQNYGEELNELEQEDEHSLELPTTSIRAATQLQEERQNALNHEAAENLAAMTQDDGSGMNTQVAEVTDNMFNERQQELQELLLDDSNLNVIAENNNNANIERELQDITGDVGIVDADGVRATTTSQTVVVTAVGQLTSSFYANNK